MASSLYKKDENGSLKKVATLYSESDIEEIVNPLLGDYLPLTGGTLNGNLIVNGVSTFQNTDYTSGVENQVVKCRFKTASNQYGAIYFGKEGPNNGAMIRLDQVEGTARLYFRASSTAGAIVWNQPENGSQLFFDVSKVNFRTAGYLADATAFRPSSNGTKDLGASAYKFKNVYATSFYENGTLLSSKYAAKSHNHAISDITSLQETLDRKADYKHDHIASDIVDLDDILERKLDIENQYYIIDKPSSSIPFSIREKGEADRRIRWELFKDLPSAKIAVAGHELIVAPQHLYKGIGGQAYELLDESMALTEAELNEILV